MKTWKIVLISFGVIVLFIGLSYGFGWIGVHQTKTFKKAQRTATKQVEREVFEQTQSYVEGKRQEAVKYRLEYMGADSTDKEAIRMTIVQSFSNFDESLLNDDILESFIKSMKY